MRTIEASRKPGKSKKQKSLSAFEAGLALLSAIVGGGIVGIPYAMFHTGIPLGLALNIAVAAAGWYTGGLYLRVKDLAPTYVESLYELGFVTMGVASIYLISALVLISGIGCIMIYFIVFSNISASIAESVVGQESTSVLKDRSVYVIVLAFLMFPLCMKKMLAEMKIVSVLLFLAIAIFILLFLVQLITMGSIENHDETYGRYYMVDLSMELVTGLNIIVLAYAYQINLFPTYNSLGANKSNKTGLDAVAVAQGLSIIIYVSLGVLSIYIFGSDLEASVLKNVDEEKNIYSYIIRVAFLVVLGCHIPYIFFPTKESLLIIVDQATNASMTKAITDKLKQAPAGVNQANSDQDEKAAQPTYLKMPNVRYYGISVALYVACVTASVFVSDLGAVFEFVGAFGLSMTSFTLPGLMYLLVINNPQSKQGVETAKQRKWNKVGAVSVICLSLLNMLLVVLKQAFPSSDAIKHH